MPLWRKICVLQAEGLRVPRRTSFNPETGARRQVRGRASRWKKEALSELLGASARATAVGRSAVALQDYLADWPTASRS